MNPFSYVRAADLDQAVREGAAEGARFIAGGTNLLDLMKENVERPRRLIDINGLPLDRIEETPGGGLRIGALVRNADLAADARLRARYPLLCSALLAGASPQLRNMATTGGNLMQRTRCYYFYDVATPCNKRRPGSGCGAVGGVTRIHAILGASAQCIATHPSDMCVALAALEARVHVLGPGGPRSMAFADFHRLPGDTPQLDNNLAPGELITGVELPPEGFSRHHSYLKIRDRAAYAFALVSVAAALRMEGGRIAAARVALGGVAHKPWRRPDAEQALAGAPANPETFTAFASVLLEGAQGQGDNDFKIVLARRAIVRALTQAAHGTPQSQTDKRIA
ncbi:FAD binding domain-containing protein [Parapusillimonas granuli]|uniref:Xanthine dehydrogenase family protein subunit M n=1 Tax=Parapusillimonas granuli TaxID=380911 RepID=A0A853G058_9BURK|nr:xanthine dehydrogenase family protein subunit M [Parapusillimonas granuli]MBB5214187.1 xanthine dehydrogenase YagS FAD-binding subunit [Parapusillimonas granuli]NYT50608.1 xanthine dehydrogenase family protein subunit M [Parapusillimonas granuli]